MTMAMQTKPSIVFAHGLWADGSCFQKLIPTLLADGHEVICSQHGLDSLKSDVDCVTRCFGRVSGPVVLVGRSYGGTLITHAGTDDRVAALVYIAALAPDEDETSQSLINKFPTTEYSLTSKSRTGAFGSARKASGLSLETCRRRSRRSSGRPRACQLWTCSTRRLKAPPGGRSRAGTSWPRMTVPSIPIWNASSRSAWAPRLLRSKAVTSPCSPSPAS
jgi:pimeloyl-ACP methyl ester carboxylesterase